MATEDFGIIQVHTHAHIMIYAHTTAHTGSMATPLYDNSEVQYGGSVRLLASYAAVCCCDHPGLFL